jgi:pimeloyl-ACP methyl ester carboxylesterase
VADGRGTGRVASVAALNGMVEVWQAGPPDADAAVVLLHGAPGPTGEWSPLLQQVGGFTRAIRPGSSRLWDIDRADRFRLRLGSSYAAWLAALLDDLDIHTALTFRGR